MYKEKRFVLVHCSEVQDRVLPRAWLSGEGLIAGRERIKENLAVSKQASSP